MICHYWTAKVQKGSAWLFHFSSSCTTTNDAHQNSSTVHIAISTRTANLNAPRRERIRVNSCDKFPANNIIPNHTYRPCAHTWNVYLRQFSETHKTCSTFLRRLIALNIYITVMCVWLYVCSCQLRVVWCCVCTTPNPPHSVSFRLCSHTAVLLRCSSLLRIYVTDDWIINTQITRRCVRAYTHFSRILCVCRSGRRATVRSITFLVLGFGRIRAECFLCRAALRWRCRVLHICTCFVNAFVH